MTATHLLRGSRAERAARRWLEARNLSHIESNYYCHYGELDLVMLEDQCLVIIEVRYRQSEGYGGALESVTPVKQQRIARATQHFLQHRRKHAHRPLRFDVLAVSGAVSDKENATTFVWRRQAFCIEY
jgi:putative endonuclease